MSDVATIYGFISDEIFWNKKTIDLQNDIASVGLGYLDDININYFHKVGAVYDPRDSRLDILGEVPVGQIKVLFDVSKVQSSNPFSTMDEETVKIFMNIVEKCYITQNRTEEQLNDELFADSSTYQYFVRNSAMRSAGFTTYKPASMTSTLKIYDFIEFDIKINEVQTHFKLWLNVEKFLLDYPLTTITKVIPPCKEEYLLDSSALVANMQTVLSSGEYVFTKSNEGTYNVDNTGVLPYKTKLVISSQNIPQVTFGLVYQGAKPSSLEARKAIREHLMSLSMAPEDTWESKLPDLFITAEFYIVPMWGNRYPRPNYKDGFVYPSIVNHTYAYDELKKMLPSFELDWLREHAEVSINSYNSILLMSVPDPLNDTEYLSMNKLLETYQAYAPDDSAFVYQENHVQDYSRKLGKIISVLYGSTSLGNDPFTTNYFYGRRYLSFSSNKIEYHVLYKDDYFI